jgi:hypothetical protein
MEIPVNITFLSFVALAWVVLIAARAGAQVTMTQDPISSIWVRAPNWMSRMQCRLLTLPVRGVYFQ